MRHATSYLSGLVLLIAGATAHAAIAVNPTAADELPPAIVGEGGDPAGSHVHYHSANEDARGYLAVPEGAGPHPAVILIHEWNGLVDRIRQTADSFAAEGYVALAADLYSGRTGSNREENMALVRETLAEPDAIIANLNAAVKFLEARNDTTGKVAAIGWCYGGGVALSFALGSDAHDGTAIFYGRLLDDPEQMQHIHHEVYGTFAENDSGIPPEQVHAFVEALRAAGVENDVHIYDHVNHGFWLHVDRDPETSSGPALDAWQRLKAYLDRTLGS
ncbi:MAG: dienelactone hydrolase family protein [Gammaproteobacteria bacterium]|nr:dienelactone hydrolase family protein [Gammaproteobacteria bacterium]